MTTAHSYHGTDKKPRVSVEEYLEREFYSETKNEYINGEIVPLWGTTLDENGQVVAMAGTSVNHVKISGNLYAAMRSALRDEECFVFASDLRVKAEACESYYYPDLGMACGEEKYNSDNPPALLNPSVIIEILSKSTSAKDRGEKFECYLSIPSLQEYILASTHTPKIEHYVRLEDGRWLLLIWVGLDATFVSEALGAQIPLRDIYAKVNFDSPVAEASPKE